MRLSAFGILVWTLALFGRVVAPMAAVEARIADPLAGAVICTHDGGSAPVGTPDAPLPEHDHCSLFCCQIAPALDAPPLVLAAPDRASHIVAAPVRRDLPAHSRPHAANRARGPPATS